MKSIKSSHLRGEKPGNVLYSRLKRWINYSDCFDTSIIWPITDPRFDSSSRIFKRFFFLKKKILLSAQSRSLSNVEMLLHRAPHALSALAQTAVWKCLEQIRCRISVWSWAAPQPRLSQRAWPAAAAEADMHRIYSTDNFSSPYKLPNSVRYLS